MSNAPRLELRQGQSLVMTQQLQQSIKLLQSTSAELREFIEQELEKNPFLQMEESEAEAAPASPEEDAPREESEFSADEARTPEAESWDESASIERDYMSNSQPVGSGEYAADDLRGIDDNPSKGHTLQEHLFAQMVVDITDPVDRLIASQLIDAVDEAGYIKEEMSTIANNIGVEREEVEAVLATVQSFDPPGVCARTLGECLALQLREQDRLDPAMQALLDHLHLMADAKFEELQKKCGVDLDDLKEMIAEIRALNPKPGSEFVYEVSQAIEPDAFVRRTPDGEWHVELNMNNFPKVMVNKRYYQQINKETSNKKDKAYLAEQFGSANWLIRALEQRADTLLKVTSELVKQQDAFFRLGVRYMKPMTLKDIAAQTGHHESTVSRVTTGKYLVCPRGTFELKYFFTSALSRSVGGGDDVSSQAVKDYINELIEKETASSILSDDDIAARLKERNIEVARRTVAKYREAMGIPSSPKRRRLKKQSI